jgi:hypothetical protein
MVIASERRPRPETAVGAVLPSRWELSKRGARVERGPPTYDEVRMSGAQPDSQRHFDVFVSHAAEDRAIAKRVEALLEQKGYRSFLVE